MFPSGCEARAINLSNKNVKIGIFTGGTSVRSKNIFTDISRFPAGMHEINSIIYFTNDLGDKKVAIYAFSLENPDFTTRYKI